MDALKAFLPCNLLCSLAADGDGRGREGGDTESFIFCNAHSRHSVYMVGFNVLYGGVILYCCCCFCVQPFIAEIYNSESISICVCVSASESPRVGFVYVYGKKAFKNMCMCESESLYRPSTSPNDKGGRLR